MKKLGIIILFILLLSVGGLWYLGGRQSAAPAPPTLIAAAVPAVNSPPRPIIRPAWEKAFQPAPISTEKSESNPPVVALVVDALKKKQVPLLPIEILPTAPNRIYELTDLKLTEQTSEEALAEYGAKLVQIMSVYESPGLGNEVKLVSEIVNDGQPDLLGGIIKAAKRYRATIKQLLALAAPKSIGQAHLNLINALARLGENAQLMAQVNDEPVIALGAAKLQPSRLRQTLSAIGVINLFFAWETLLPDNQLAKTNIVIDL